MTLRTIRSFVRRTGRLSPSKKQILEDYTEKYCQDPEKPLQLESDHFSRFSKIILEIGFGMGHSFVEMAKNNPDWLYIGIEVHTPGVAEVMAQLEAQQMNNVIIYHHDAVEVLKQAIPEGVSDKVQIFFPDPWPKKRHHKRRLIQAEFVAKLHPKLKKDAMLHIATDWQPYADSIIEMMQPRGDFELIPYQNESIYQRVQTKYQTRGEGLGHEISDLYYKKI